MRLVYFPTQPIRKHTPTRTHSLCTLARALARHVCTLTRTPPRSPPFRCDCCRKRGAHTRINDRISLSGGNLKTGGGGGGEQTNKPIRMWRSLNRRSTCAHQAALAAIFPIIFPPTNRRRRRRRRVRSNSEFQQIKCARRFQLGVVKTPLSHTSAHTRTHTHITCQVRPRRHT